MRVYISKETTQELERLLALDDKQLREHKTGKLIRDNFRLRGWLKAQARGKSGFKTKEIKDYD